MIGLPDRLAWIVTAPGFAQTSESDLRALLVLLAHADEDGHARPSAERVAELAGVSRRTVFRVRQRLVELGLVEPVRRGGAAGGTVYRLAPGATERCLGPRLRRDKGATQHGTQAGESSATQGGTQETPKSATQDGTQGLGPCVPRGASCVPNRAASVPPRVSPEHQNTRTPSARESDDDGELVVPVSEVDAALDALAARGHRPRFRPMGANRCRAFLEAGETLERLLELAELAETQAGGDGLLWWWLKSADRWRPKLEDAERIRGESRRRRAVTRALASEGAGLGSRRWAPSTPADVLGNRAPWLRVARSRPPTSEAACLTPSAAQGRAERRVQGVGT